ncbi:MULTISPECIES: biotin transporter BioY [unclassified Roseibium]|uniref:biotin transporter BioY n=1 Tax=unclassified Roseibium TaxID=2629323 RepID=UPI00317FADFB
MADRSLVHIAFYAAIIAVLGLVPAIYLPWTGPVPITAQTLGIMLAGIMLGPVRGALAVLLFLFVVALGAPFLAGGRGGIGWFYSTTGGFLIGFPVGAFVAGLVMQATRGLSVLISAAMAAAIGGILVIYAFGVPGMAYWGNMSLAKAATIASGFIPGDLIKVVLAALIAQTIARGLPSAMVSRN